jgi:hypothetical protein
MAQWDAEEVAANLKKHRVDFAMQGPPFSMNWV